MTRAILILLLCAGCAPHPKPKTAVKKTRKVEVRVQVQRTYTQPDLPPMHLPVESRQKNYGPSCVWASTQNALRSMNQDEIATFLRQNYSGGSDLGRLRRALDSNGVRYAYTANGSESFLDWMGRTHRSAMIFFRPNHACCLAHITATHAYVLDPNATGHYDVIERGRFIRSWRSYGGVALVPLYTPTPPM
jgi:hypothetical protein